MNENTIKGDIKQAKGAVEKEFGKMTGNTGHQVKGAVKQAAGEVQSSFGKGQEEADKEDKNS